jgi:biotin transporter BioY
MVFLLTAFLITAFLMAAFLMAAFPMTAFLMTAFLMGGASAYCPGIASLASVRLIRWTAEQSSVSMHMDVGTFSNIEVYS